MRSAALLHACPALNPFRALSPKLICGDNEGGEYCWAPAFAPWAFLGRKDPGGMAGGITRAGGAETAEILGINYPGK